MMTTIKDRDIKKAAKPQDYFFRFLFGLQKGSRVWGKAPLLPLKSRKNNLIICRVLTLR